MLKNPTLNNCDFCGQEYLKKWHQHRFCTRACNIKYWTNKRSIERKNTKPPPRICVNKRCGAVFYSKHSHRKYCSVPCRTKYFNRNHYVRYIGNPAAVKLRNKKARERYYATKSPKHANKLRERYNKRAKGGYKCSPSHIPNANHYFFETPTKPLLPVAIQSSWEQQTDQVSE